MVKKSFYGYPSVQGSNGYRNWHFFRIHVNFANSWLPHAFDKRVTDVIVAVAVVSTITLLVIVLYRILRSEFGGQETEKFYRTTLRMFIIRICIPFGAMLIIMIKRAITVSF
jgi:hypothetical protein